MMRIKDLDGFWRITFHYIPTEGFALVTAHATVSNGRLAGVDVGGCTFDGIVRINPDGTLILNSLWGAAHADKDVFLPTLAGSLTKGQVAMSVILKATVVGDTFLLDGSFMHGAMSIDVNAEKVEQLDGRPKGS